MLRRGRYYGDEQVSYVKNSAGLLQSSPHQATAGQQGLLDISIILARSFLGAARWAQHRESLGQALGAGDPFYDQPGSVPVAGDSFPFKEGLLNSQPPRPPAHTHLQLQRNTPGGPDGPFVLVEQCSYTEVTVTPKC